MVKFEVTMLQQKHFFNNFEHNILKQATHHAYVYLFSIYSISVDRKTQQKECTKNTQI